MKTTRDIIFAPFQGSRQFVPHPGPAFHPRNKETGRLGFLFAALAASLLAGCAGLQQNQLTGLENIAAGLLCAQSGVCLTVGAPGQCVPPPLPDALLQPCPPPDPNKSARDNAAIQMQCSIASSTLLAVVEYSKAVCPAPAVPAATRSAAPAKQVIYLNR